MSALLPPSRPVRAKPRTVAPACLDAVYPERLPQAGSRRARHERGLERKSEIIRFAGYAALFGIADGAGDVIRKGAFAHAIAQHARRPFPLWWQHRPGAIGRIETLAEDARGLRVVARIERAGGRAAAALARGEVNGLSFGYRARRHRPLPGGRLLEDIELIEVSLVTHPLQPGARVHLIA